MKVGCGSSGSASPTCSMHKSHIEVLFYSALLTHICMAATSTILVRVCNDYEAVSILQEPDQRDNIQVLCDKAMHP